MESLIRQAAKLHSATGIAHKLLKLMQHEDFSVRQVSHCIQRDPALTARVLATINAARHGIRLQVSNIQQAVMLLGRRKLRTVVLSFSIIERLSQGVDRNIYRDYWKRSLTTSLVAHALSETRSVDRHDAYTTGLLADIGVLVLAQFEPDQYREVFAQHPHGQALVSAEQEAFGFDHAALGARLLESWHFPQELVVSVATHHGRSTDSNGLSDVVQAGNLLPAAIWIAANEPFQAAYHFFHQNFEFNIDSFVAFAVEVNEYVEEEARAYQIEGVTAVDCEQLRHEALQRLNATKECSL